jgi:SAM-dependent methyltransferase
LSDHGALLSELYRRDDAGAWNRGMRAISRELLANVQMPAGPLLELGCGGGVFADELATEHAPTPVVAFDLRLHALAYAQHRAAHLWFVQGNLHNVSFADHTFGLVTALDVVDQRGVDPVAALAEIRRILMPHGWLLVRVSAHGYLYGAHDQAFNTGRRYTRRDLLQLLAHAGFAVRRVTYVNALLSGPIAAVRLLQRWQVLPFSPDLYQDALANTLLRSALASEVHWLSHWDLPLGIGLCVLAQRSESPGADSAKKCMDRVE